MADDGSREHETRGRRSDSTPPLWVLVITAVGIAIVVAFAIVGLVMTRKDKSTGSGIGAGPTPALVQVVSVRSKPISRTITQVVFVQKAARLPVVPDQAGWVVNTSVTKGSMVKTGQVIAVIRQADDRTTQSINDYQTAVNNLNSAETNLINAKNALSANRTAVEDATAVLARAKTVYDDAQISARQAETNITMTAQALQARTADAQQAQKLYDNGAIARNELQQAQNAQSQAEVAAQQAKDALTAARANEQDAVAHVKIRQEELNKAAALKEQAGAMVKSLQQVVAERQADVDRALSRLRSVERRQKRVELKSPIDGIITDRPVAPGTLITPSIPVTYIEPKFVKVLTFTASQTEAGKLQVGYPVIVPVSDRKQKLTGKVGAITADTAGGVGSYKVFIHIFDPASVLNPGKRVKALITTQKMPAIVVPKSAIDRLDRQDIVWLVTDDIVRMRPVIVGGSSGSNIIVKMGLKPGNIVVIHTDKPLREGTLVNIEKSK